MTTSPTPTASPATGSFTAPAGRVVVSCLGAALHDWSLEPASSASIRAIRLSDAELGIRMVDASGTVLHVLATCRDGGPVFTTS